MTDRNRGLLIPLIEELIASAKAFESCVDAGEQTGVDEARRQMRKAIADAQQEIDHRRQWKGRMGIGDPDLDHAKALRAGADAIARLAERDLPKGDGSGAKQAADDVEYLSKRASDMLADARRRAFRVVPGTNEP